jgi:CubicO group peptidase (beta-lactamase class C family)
VTDLLAFARELLDPQLLDPALLTEATRVAFPGLDGVLPGFGRQSPNDWGLGFELRGTKAPHWTGCELPPTTFGHFGQSGSFLWVDADPRHRLCGARRPGLRAVGEGPVARVHRRGRDRRR